MSWTTLDLFVGIVLGLAVGTGLGAVLWDTHFCPEED